MRRCWRRNDDRTNIHLLEPVVKATYIVSKDSVHISFYVAPLSADFSITLFSPAGHRRILVYGTFQVEILCALFSVIANHPLEPITRDTVNLLGCAPRTFESFLSDYSGAFSKQAT